MGRTERIERTFSVAEGCLLDVSNMAGSTTVTGREGNEVHIVALKHCRSERAAEGTEIDIGQEGQRVWARTRVHRRRGRSWLGARHTATVEYIIELPRQSQVKVRGVSATADVGSIQGKIDIGAVSGSITVRDLQGSLNIRCVSGDVSGEALHGQLQLETVSGKAELADSDFSSLKAKSVSGGLRIATRLQSGGRYEAQTVSGNVEFLVPPTTRCTVEGHTISGRLRTPLAHTSQRPAPGTWHIEVEGGGTPLHFDSVSGDLILTVVEEEVSAEPTRQEGIAPQVQAETRRVPAAPIYGSAMDILNAVDAGKLTAEEATSLIRQLRTRQEM